MKIAGERFAGDWLDLREPADHAARSEQLAANLSRFLSDRVELSVIDLGAGSGSNLRWLAPRLPGGQRWQLLDRDAALLERVRAPSVEFETRCMELNEMPLDLFEGVDLVTASALCDLASRDWIEQVVSALERSGAAALFALTVDGRRGFLDAAGRVIEDEEDRHLVELFNRHQRRAKGLGEALGPEAAGFLPTALEGAGLSVYREAADWRLAAGQAGALELAVAELANWAGAAAQQAPDSAARIRSWQERRLRALESGRLGLYIGHVDVLALPIAS